MIKKENNEFSVECHAQVAADCDKNGAYCSSEEEAKEWVEDECWIFSGEGWICVNCHDHFMRNLAKTRRDQGLNDIDTNLEVGIETVK